MKLSLLTTAFLLTSSTLFASSSHTSALQEGVNAVNLLDKALKKYLPEKIEEAQAIDSNISTGTTCIAVANNILEHMNSKLPAHIKMRLVAPDSKHIDKKELVIFKKYQKDIQKKTAGALLSSSQKKAGLTHVYKPVIIDETWLQCYDNNSSKVKLGDLKGLLVSEVSTH